MAGWRPQLEIASRQIERARSLSEIGFFHVTGLPIVGIGQQRHERNVIQAQRGQLNHCDCVNGLTAMITHDGEVWIKSGGVPEDIDWMERGVFVPCSNGAFIPLPLILERAVDPYSDCGGRYSPIPEIRD